MAGATFIIKKETGNAVFPRKIAGHCAGGGQGGGAFRGWRVFFAASAGSAAHQLRPKIPKKHARAEKIVLADAVRANRRIIRRERLCRG